MNAKEIVKSTMKEQLYCLGKVFSRHHVSDEVIWEVVKGFDLIYEKEVQKVITSNNELANSQIILPKEPHPGLMHLLEKLDN